MQNKRNEFPTGTQPMFFTTLPPKRVRIHRNNNKSLNMHGIHIPFGVFPPLSIAIASQRFFAMYSAIFCTTHIKENIKIFFGLDSM